MISVYDSKEIAFTNNGLVVLSDTISCLIVEELNGMYECTLEYPLDSHGKWQYLVEENVIKADGQLFRIYKKVKTLSSVKINARHIFYDLLENMCEDDRLTNEDGARALEWTLDDNCQYPHPFTNTSDLGITEHTRYYARRNPIDIIMNPDDGIIATWGGELVRDNFSISLLQARGASNGVLIAYGKNIQGIEETLDMDDLCTRLMPVGKAAANGEHEPDGLLLPEKYLDSPYLANYPLPKIRIQSFNDIAIAEASNCFDPQLADIGHSLDADNGNLGDNALYFTSALTGVEPNSEYWKNNAFQYALYDQSGTFVRGGRDFQFATGANTVYVKVTDTVENLQSFILSLSLAERTVRAVNKLRKAGQKYLDSGIDIPKFNYKIDFLELSKTVEYKDFVVLETAEMGDTAIIRHSRLNLDLTAKVIKTTKNKITKRTEKIELGNFLPKLFASISSSIQGIQQGATQDRVDWQQAIAGGTQIWVQPNLPTTAKTKDVWVDTDDYSRYDATFLSVDTTLGISDSEMIEAMGTINITLHTATSIGIIKKIYNTGTGIVTIIGTINDKANMLLYPGESIELITDGSNWRC